MNTASLVIQHNTCKSGRVRAYASSILCLLLILQTSVLCAANDKPSLLNIQTEMQNHPELHEIFNNPQAVITERKNRILQRLIRTFRPQLIHSLTAISSDSTDLILALQTATSLRIQDKEFIDAYVNLLHHPSSSVAQQATKTISTLLPDDLMLLNKIYKLSEDTSYPLAKYEILLSFANAGSAEAESMLIDYLNKIIQNSSSKKNVINNLIDLISDALVNLELIEQNSEKIQTLLIKPNLYLRHTKPKTAYPNHDIYQINPILVRWFEQLSQKKFLFRSQFEDIGLIFQMIQKHTNQEQTKNLLELLMLKVAVHKNQLSLSDHLMIARALKPFAQTKLTDYLNKTNDSVLEQTALKILELANKSIIGSDPEIKSLIIQSKNLLIRKNLLVCQKIY